MNSLNYHIPALLAETIEGLRIVPDGVYVDLTYGGGGHSRAIVEHLGDNGRLLGFDQDEDVLQNVIDDSRFVFVKSNFRYLSNFLKYHQVEQVDGILADLGVSSHHFDSRERGFSFRFEGDLDMRMNKNATLSAKEVLNNYEEKELANIFYLYGEMKKSRKLASAIVRERKEQKIEKIEHLVKVVTPFIKKEKEKKELSMLFQALRIEVNQELEALKEMLMQTVSALKPGGRLAILTYHSLEDRLVKNFFRSGNFDGKVEKDFYGNIVSPFQIINKKVIMATDEEIERNPRARSAKLRIATKK